MLDTSVAAISGVRERWNAFAQWITERYPGYFKPEAPGAEGSTPRSAGNTFFLHDNENEAEIVAAQGAVPAQAVSDWEIEGVTRGTGRSGRMHAWYGESDGEKNRGFEGCTVQIEFEADAKQHFLPVIATHEVMHCAIRDHLDAEERMTALARIAETVRLETLAKDWYGTLTYPPDYEGPKTTNPEIGERSAQGYWNGLGLPEAEAVTRRHPETGELHLNADLMTVATPVHGDSSTLAERMAQWVEEAAVRMTTHEGLEHAPGTAPALAPEPGAARTMTPEQMTAHVRALVQDAGQVYAEKMTVEDLRKRNTALLDPDDPRWKERAERSEPTRRRASEGRGAARTHAGGTEGTGQTLATGKAAERARIKARLAKLDGTQRPSSASAGKATRRGQPTLTSRTQREQTAEQAQTRREQGAGIER